MKYIILIALFLVGCTNHDNYIELSERYTHLENAMREMKYEIHHLKNKNESHECVMYLRSLDTHAMATITVPIDGIYYMSSYSLGTTTSFFKAGTVLQKVQDLIKDTCPQFKEISKKARQ